VEAVVEVCRHWVEDLVVVVEEVFPAWEAVGVSVEDFRRWVVAVAVDWEGFLEAVEDWVVECRHSEADLEVDCRAWVVVVEEDLEGFSVVAGDWVVDCRVLEVDLGVDWDHCLVVVEDWGRCLVAERADKEERVDMSIRGKDGHVHEISAVA